MTQSEKKKRRQIIILIILSVLLLAVVYWQYLLVPKMTACEELSNEIADNEITLSAIQGKVLAMPGYERDIDEALANIDESTADLYPVMNNEDADIMLLQRMEKCGLNASSLSVTAAAAGADEKKKSTDDDNTGVYVITAKYEAHGSYTSLLSFISEMNKLPAAVITSMKGTSAASEEKTYTVGGGRAETNITKQSASETDMTFELSIDVYMYQPPEIPDHFDVQRGDTSDDADTGTDTEISDYL